MQARTIATIIGGMATHVLAALAWYAGWRLFHGDLLKFWVNLILPFGAFALGLLGGIGFLIAGRLVKQPATQALLWSATAIAVLAAFVIRFLGYWSIEFGGVPLHQVMGFLPYLQMTLGHAQMDIGHGGHSLGTVQLGAFGYLMEALQTAAYAAASFASVATLPRAVRCDRGHGPMREKLWGKVRIDGEGLFGTWYRQLPPDPVARLMALEARDSDSGKVVTESIELRYRRVECSECSQAAVAETGVVHTGKYWAPCKPLTRVIKYDRTVSTARAAPPAPPVMPGPRSFGRRTI